MSPQAAPLNAPYSHLKATGRGKHIGPFSYYHVALVSQAPEAADELSAIARLVDLGNTQYNVVKLDAKYRISFLLYEDFDVLFPALFSAVSCNLSRRSVRRRNYAKRGNPPILHRKELLLPQDHPLVPKAARLTERLERLGAFVDTTTIGTRLGWQCRLDILGLDAAGRRVG